MPDFNVIIKPTPAMLVAARRVTIPTNDRFPKYLDPAFIEAYDYVRGHGAQDNAPCFALWHVFVYGKEDAKAVVPIDRRLAGTDRVRVYELAQTQVAARMHCGDFEAF